jgi:hypothetical protein
MLKPSADAQTRRQKRQKARKNDRSAEVFSFRQPKRFQKFQLAQFKITAAGDCTAGAGLGFGGAFGSGGEPTMGKSRSTEPRTGEV